MTHTLLSDPTERTGGSRELVVEMRDLAAPSAALRAYNFAYLALVWGVALGAIAVYWAWPHWYTFVLAFLLISSRHQALLNCEHECIHGKFVGGRRANQVIGRWLCAAGAGSPYAASQARHLSHHRLLGTDEDPDGDLHSGPAKRTRAGLARHFLGGLVGGYAGMVLLGPPAKGVTQTAAGRRNDLRSLLVVQGALFAGLWVTCAWWVYPALWVAPLVTVTVLMHLVRSFVEHAVTDAELPRHASRLITITSNRLERGLVAPYFMNYHAEHHLHPGVPAPRLHRLQRRLADREDLPPVLVRRSYLTALRSYWRQAL